MSLLDYVRDRYARYKIKLQHQQLLLLSSLEAWWFNQQQNQIIKVLSHPLNNKSYIVLFYFLIDQIILLKKNVSVIYITDSLARKKFLLQFTQQIMKRFFTINNGYKKVPIISSVFSLNADNSQLIIMSFKEFVRSQLPEDNVYNFMLIETSNFLRTFRDGFSDYITDTYLRRAYIEALRFKQGYLQAEKLLANQNVRNESAELTKRVSSHDVQEINITQLTQKKQKEQQLQKLRQRQLQNAESRKISKVFNNKRQQLIKGVKNKSQNKLKLFQTNQLILISSIIYLIGFFYNQLQTKKSRSINQFIDDYQSKTYMTQQFLQKLHHYYDKIYRNCPFRAYDTIQQTYLYYFCQFINKIIKYKKTFLEDYKDLFQIKIEKFPFDKRQSIIEQSTSCIMIACKQNNKICKKVIDKKCLSAFVIQNFGCPHDYWLHVFKKNVKLLSSYDSQDSHKFSKIFGLHISKTPSNQDLNFSQKLKPEIETIKIKSCGVLLYDLSKFIPDGMVVYFHSQEGLQNFSKQMQKDEQKILKRIDNNKKIFIQSVFEEQNRINYEKFVKCCEIGRGAMFLMASNGKAAQYFKFYNQLSRCIVFFGLPRKQNEIKRQHIESRNEGDPIQQKVIIQNMIQNTQKISIFNQCINNCINDIEQCKSIIFVGRQITDDLQKWYKLFIRSWDETTRESLMKLRSHFQKMGSGPTGFTLLP